MRRAALLVLCVLAAAPASAANVVVRFTTVLGEYDVELCTETSDACPGVAPISVANFLHYVDENVYPETMYVHRRGAGGASPRVIQSGGFWIDTTPPPSTELIPKFAPIALEVGTGLSNLRGTIAMARTVAPDSATSQWFINLVDNVSLDTSGGGYAVFGKVVSGLDVVDAIGALTIYNANGPNCQFTTLGCSFGELPLLSTFPGSGSVVNYLVYVSDISRVPEPGPLASAATALLALVHRLRRRSR